MSRKFFFLVISIPVVALLIAAVVVVEGHIKDVETFLGSILLGSVLFSLILVCGYIWVGETKRREEEKVDTKVRKILADNDFYRRPEGDALAGWPQTFGHSRQTGCFRLRDGEYWHKERCSEWELNPLRDVLRRETEEDFYVLPRDVERASVLLAKKGGR